MNNTDFANLTHDEVSYVHHVFETIDGWHYFQEHWPQVKQFHLRVVPEPEIEARLFYWDMFLRRMGA